MDIHASFNFSSYHSAYTVNTHPDIEKMLARNAVVAVGVSGGKDSQACALAVHRHLEAIGHTGPRVLIHADLGVVEWKDSLPTCERLAAHLGWELMVVKRKAGDMLDRWRGRWANNLNRYASLECVKLILPWSTPSMRFCTSELKVAIISSALKKRFPGYDVVNVTGIRRQESSSRSKAPVAQFNPNVVKKGAVGFTWNAIIEHAIEDVFSSIAQSGLALHEGYTKYNMSRISCVFCIMSNQADMEASASCEDNQPVYLDMVDLEIDSTFAFQGARWLGDVAPHLLGEERQRKLAQAKERALLRQMTENRIPKHLLYTAGWPTCMPTDDEAELIASVRRDVAGLLGVSIAYVTGETVKARYADLMAQQVAA